MEFGTCKNCAGTGLVHSCRGPAISLCKGALYEENVSLRWNFAKGTAAKAQGTTP